MLSLPLLLILIFLRMPIGLAMLVVGLGGTAWVSGGTLIVLAKLKGETYSTFSSYSLSIVPPVPADGAVCNAWRYVVRPV